MSDVFATIEQFRQAGIPAEHAITAARLHLGSASPDRATLPLRDLPSVLAEAVAATCLLHNVTVADVMSPTRKHNVSRARNACFAAARSMGMSLSEIGGHFHRDHSTVMHGLANHRRRTDASKAAEVSA